MGESSKWHWVARLLEWLMSLAPSEQKTLMGCWFIESTSGDYIGSWTFHPDRSVTIKACSTEGTDTWRYQEGKGTWEITDTRVLITWTGRQPNSDKPCQDTFLRPIRGKGVCGDSWLKPDGWRARKIVGR